MNHLTGLVSFPHVARPRFWKSTLGSCVVRSSVILVLAVLVPLCANSARAGNNIYIASWYGSSFHGKPMASRRVFDKNDPSIAAHVDIPLGTRLLVTNPKNNISIEVTVQDRMPKKMDERHVLDLSEAAADLLGVKEGGKVPVRIRKL